MTGNPDAYFSDFVLDLVHHIVQFQININLNDPVMKILDLLDLPVYVVKQLGIRFKTHSLNVNVHGKRYFFW
jgi:hypothetical protein